jgi:hypothetical protein
VELTDIELAQAMNLVASMSGKLDHEAMGDRRDAAMAACSTGRPPQPDLPRRWPGPGIVGSGLLPEEDLSMPEQPRREWRGHRFESLLIEVWDAERAYRAALERRRKVIKSILELPVDQRPTESDLAGAMGQARLAVRQLARSKELC